MLRVV
ncbi:putative membrane protein, partial [Yersinia pestis PY-64]